MCALPQPLKLVYVTLLHQSSWLLVTTATEALKRHAGVHVRLLSQAPMQTCVAGSHTLPSASAHRSLHELAHSGLRGQNHRVDDTAAAIRLDGFKHGELLINGAVIVQEAQPAHLQSGWCVGREAAAYL